MYLNYILIDLNINYSAWEINRASCFVYKENIYSDKEDIFIHERKLINFDGKFIYKKIN